MCTSKKREKKNNIPADAGHFLRTEIDFKNEKLTTKLRRNKARRQYFFKKIIPKDLETDETTNQNKN